MSESSDPGESPPVGDGAPSPPPSMAPATEPPAPLNPAPAPAPRRRRWRWPRLHPVALALFLRGAVLFMITGVCLLAFVMQFTGAVRKRFQWNLHDFVNTNQLTPRARTQMLVWLGAGAVGGAFVSLVLYLWRRRQRVPAARAGRVLRVARLFSPLMLPSLAWPLLVATDWDALSRVGGMAFVALLAEARVRAAAGELIAGRLGIARAFSRFGGAVRRALGRAGRLVTPETAMVLLATIFYAAWMSWGTILEHRHFGTNAYDLGNYDTMFYNALHGRPFRCPGVFPSGENWSMLASHAEWTMYALLPFYALRPGAEVLLVMQSAALALGAIPLYRFASRRLPRVAAMILTLAYLLYAPTHEANFYDVHFQPFAVLFMLWALDMLDSHRPILFTLFFLLALGCREDVPIGFAVLGVYLLVVGRHTRTAILMTIVSLTYFVIIKFVVMPRHGSWWFAEMYKDLYPTGENSYGGIVKTMLSNPIYVWKTLVTTEKIVLVALVLVPVIFLPLRRRLLWISLLPAVPFTLLTTGYYATTQISFQYVLLYVPFVFMAAALALAAYGSTPQGRARLAGALGGIAVATFLTTRVWGGMPPGDKFRGGFREIHALLPLTPEEKKKAQDLAELAAKVPKDAGLAVSEAEHPHVSTRLNALGLRSTGTEGADYIIYTPDENGADVAQGAVANGTFEVVEERPGSRLTLLRKKKP